MATLSSQRIFGLIDRIRLSRRNDRSASYDAFEVRYSAVDKLSDIENATSCRLDDAWLRRTELRGAQAVTDFLEANKFREKVGQTQTLFVDDRCGLIGGQMLQDADGLTALQAANDTLRMASGCHASGIIIATNESGMTLGRRRARDRMAFEVRRKGEAINLFLLDHFKLTSDGWQRTLAIRRK